MVLGSASSSSSKMISSTASSSGRSTKDGTTGLAVCIGNRTALVDSFPSVSATGDDDRKDSISSTFHVPETFSRCAVSTTPAAAAAAATLGAAAAISSSTASKSSEYSCSRTFGGGARDVAAAVSRRSLLLLLLLPISPVPSTGVPLGPGRLSPTALPLPSASASAATVEATDAVVSLISNATAGSESAWR